MELMRQIFWTSRPVSWVNTAFPFAAAYLLIVRDVDALFVVGTLYFLIPYNLLMYGVNDVFDYESDMQNPRKGGVEGAKLDPRYHRLVLWIAAICNIPFLIALFVMGTTTANLVLVYVVSMVIAYSVRGLRFKERPVLDSATSSTHFVGPMVYAMVLTGWNDAFWVYVLAFFAWGMASHAFGAVQDILPDRAGGIGSVATRWGAQKTVLFSTALYMLGAGAVLTQGWFLLPAAACLLLYAVNVVQFSRLSDTTSGQANRGWRRFLWLNQLTGFVVTLLVIMKLV